MSLLAKDHRLPHVFYLRAEKPVYRTGILALGVAGARASVCVRRGGQQPDPAVRDRRLHRLHPEPGGPVPPLAPGTARAVAAACGDQRHRRGDDGGRRARVAVLEVPRGSVGGRDRRAGDDVVVQRHRALLRRGRPRAQARTHAAAPGQSARASSMVPTSTVNLLTQQAAHRGAVARRHGRRGGGRRRRGGARSEIIRRLGRSGDAAPPIEVIIDPHRSLIRGVLQLRRIDRARRRRNALVTVLIAGDRAAPSAATRSCTTSAAGCWQRCSGCGPTSSSRRCRSGSDD